MKLIGIYLCAATALLVSGCATTQTDDCCSRSKPEVVYVDKAVSECTRPVQRITQVSPCAVCERFPVSARLDDICAR